MDVTPLRSGDFAAFFREVNGVDPFPWQQRLADGVLNGGWPETISLPTASGKTACIDVAVFALAAVAQRAQPRRIFFVVDRRLVVDEAYVRATRLAQKLAEAKTGVLSRVAERLRALAGGTDALPLATAILRGGIYRDDRWARSPTQPTVVLSTVDQVGSRLLFRGYGLSENAWPIHAGLIAADSLIIVDEAHTSVPFVQTLRATQRYCTAPWSPEALAPSLQVVSMSATPVEGARQATQFTLDEADRANTVLQRRLRAHKKAELAVAPDKELAFVADVSKRAVELAPGARAVGVVVNRVATARAVFAELETRQNAAGKARLDADVVLLTGRVRPLDRDALVASIRSRLFSDPGRVQESGARSLIVVATQCIEVGADLDFDALVTECAPIDALRQRFGRLDRLGLRGNSKAVVVVRKNQAPEDGSDVEDAVYGEALTRTWRWLSASTAAGAFDFGIDHFPTDGVSEDLTTPTKSAPVLLPAHVDCWAQTSPPPHADPDPAVFLHGPSDARADVQVVWRADLDPERPGDWVDIVSLCSPSSPEAMSVPLFQLRAWLAGTSATASSDVEGLDELAEDDEEPAKTTRRILRWAGPDDDRTGVVTSDDQIRPGDTFVIPAALGGCDRFGWNPASVDAVVDLGDQAQALRRNAVLRMSPETLGGGQWSSVPTSQALAPYAAATPEDELDEDGLRQALSTVAVDDGAPPWLRDVASHLAKRVFRTIPHPSGHGIVITAVQRLPSGLAGVLGEFADDVTSSTGAGVVPLSGHSERVASMAGDFARSLGLKAELVSDLSLAGMLHDWGKADPRFQLWLAGGDRAVLASAGGLIAKSPRLPRSSAALRKARERSGYPRGGRHELLSTRLAEAEKMLLSGATDRDLVLHLVEAHHGRCRPLAPDCVDPAPLKVSVPAPGGNGAATTATRLEALDSGVLERFWSLVHRYGWWGLAYLEGILRLADQRVSEVEREGA